MRTLTSIDKSGGGESKPRRIWSNERKKYEENREAVTGDNAAGEVEIEMASFRERKIKSRERENR